MRAITTESMDLMRRFAERTGLGDGPRERRYLWTDTFAVCNFVGLADATGDAAWMTLARRLVERVHLVLGAYRPDDDRTGRLDGASAAYPTRGGLRIGKRLPERGPAEGLDERLEWDRDGQYFHYLTKWMHALDQMARATREPDFHLWACELAATAHRAFSYVPRGGGVRRLYWKMSVDLSRPLVPSMGQHDPLDGCITCLQLATAAPGRPLSVGSPDLRQAAADFAAMIGGSDLATADPLGLGGLLADACRVAQLMRAGVFADGRLLQALLACSVAGLDVYARHDEWRQPATNRLAFRELGLAIGLEAAGWLRTRPELASAAPVRRLLDALERYAPLGDELVRFWREPVHHATPGWSQHEDINEVMLATSLAPQGFLLFACATP